MIPSDAGDGAETSEKSFLVSQATYMGHQMDRSKDRHERALRRGEGFHSISCSAFGKVNPVHPILPWTGDEDLGSWQERSLPAAIPSTPLPFLSNRTLPDRRSLL